MHRNQKFLRRRSDNSRGFTLLEVVMAMAVAIILTAISMPIVKTTLANYRMTSAVNSVTGVINSSRYRAIYNGYPYNITFTKANGTTIPAAQYQLANKIPPATSFTNVGTTIPVVSNDVTLNSNVTLEFSPGGKVTATTGSLSNIKLTYKEGTSDAQSRTITVTTYGNISVANP